MQIETHPVPPNQVDDPSIGAAARGSAANEGMTDTLAEGTVGCMLAMRAGPRKSPIIETYGSRRLSGLA